MRFASMVIGVCHPQKLAWMPQVLKSINNGEDNFKFDRKIVAIDEFNGWKFPAKLFTEFRGMDWIVIKDNHKSRPLSMQHALRLMNEEICFYHEDDVLVSMPPKEKIEEIFNHKLADGRTCGMISLTLGGTMAWFSSGLGVGDLANVEANKILEWDGAVAFRRDEEKRDKHFFEFPGLFIRRDVLQMCLTHSMKSCRRMQIEQGLTKAWFDLGLDKQFYKCSLARSNLVQTLKEDHKRIFDNCRFLSNLDPMQGNSPYFGSHHI